MTPVPPSDPAEPSGGSPPKTWRTGTLTYTTAGLFILFFWLLWGDFAWFMKDRSVQSVVSVLLKKAHASDFLVGILFGALPSALIIILGPIVSYKSDRHRGRWGRRIPFLLIPTPIAVIGIVCLAFSPQIGEALHRMLGPHSLEADSYTLLFIAGSWTVFEVATVIASAVYYALINDVVPKELLGRFFGAFRALSLVAGIILNFWILGGAETYYTWIFLGIAAVYGIGFSMMCLKVKEGEYPAVVPMDVGRDTKGFFHAAKTYFQECFSKPYYWLFFITWGISWQAFIPVNLFSYFFSKEIGMPYPDYTNCIGWTYVISLFLAYPLGVLVDWFHPLRVTIVVMTLYAAITLWGGLFIHNTTTFAIALIANGVLAGTWFTAVASLAQRLLPKAEFAQFFSAASIVGSLCAIFVGTATGVILDYMHHIYQYTFLLSFSLAVVSVILSLVLHRKFMALGGPKNYVAPEGLNKRLF